MSRQIGKVRSRIRHGSKIWYLDFRPHGEVYSIPSPVGRRPIPIRDEETAREVLASIRAAIVEGKTLEQALAPFLGRKSEQLRVLERARLWLELLKEKVAVGDLSPTYLRELRRYFAADRYGEFWQDASIYQVTYATLESYGRWLANRGLSGSTRKKVLDAYRSFLHWLRKRGDLERVPAFPTIPQDEYRPTVVTTEAQFRILDAIPWDRRGAFLACRLGIRPGEVRALDLGDFDGEKILVSKAVKGPNAHAPVRGTKSRTIRPVYPDAPLLEWLRWRGDPVAPGERIQGRMPLFPNPSARNREKRWIANALREEWNRACREVGVRVRMYEGTKHSSASAALRSGTTLERVQRALGHADRRSTERYAKLDDQAVVDVFPTRPASGRDCGRIVASHKRRPKTPLRPRTYGGADGTRTRNFRRDRPVL